MIRALEDRGERQRRHNTTEPSDRKLGQPSKKRHLGETLRVESLPRSTVDLLDHFRAEREVLRPLRSQHGLRVALDQR